MNIVFAASEAVPFAKTGGLADVVGALPREMERLGHDVQLFLPAYREALESGPAADVTDYELDIPIASKHVGGRLLRSRLPESQVTVWLVDQPDYYDRPQLYGEHGRDYQDNCERFVFFCRAVMEGLVQMDRPVDLLHCHDWQTGLIPAYRELLYGHHRPFAETATLLTIHNLAYQGRFWHWDMLLTGIDWKYFNWKQMEFHGDLNLLKTGIVFADRLSTVSPTYAEEIQSEPLGCGLSDVLRHRADVLTGIVNGIDTDHWNPATDAHLAQTYDADTWQQGKAACRAALQQASGLAVEPRRPLIGLIGRLASQKGWEITLPLLEQQLASSDLQWIVLGSGDPAIERRLRQLMQAHPDRLHVTLAFDEAQAHRIEAGADIFVMASRYEPCGLNQLYSLRYGTVPIVHATGGLIDTIIDVTPQTLAARSATGFHFHHYSTEALTAALQRAVTCYRDDPDVWKQLVDTGMRQDWSWARSAREYDALYQQTCAEHRRRLGTQHPR